MGCLLEFCLELFFEVFIELIGHCYIKLMQLIVPQKVISDKTRIVIKRAVTIAAVLLAVVFILGIILFLQADPAVKTVGRYITHTSLIVVAAQIALGIAVKIIEHYRK